MKIINNLVLTTTLLLLTTTSLYASEKKEICKHAQKASHHDNADLAKTVKKLEAQVESLEMRAAEKNTDSDVKLSLAPAPKMTTSDGRYSFALNGYVQGDMGDYAKDIDSNNTIGQITRARLSASGVIDKDFAYKIEANLDPAGNSKLKTATLGYNGMQNVNLTVGLFAPTIGLENSASSRNYTFIESASVSNIFPPNNDLGVQASYFNNNATATFGAFTKNSQVSDGQAYTFRTTYAPINEAGKIVHFGANASHRNFSKTAKFALQEGPGSNINYPKSAVYNYNPIDTGNIANIKNQQIYGAEFAYAYNQFSVQTEYMISKLKSYNAKANVKSYYAQLAYTITGESRSYDAASGTFGGITPGQNFSVKDGGIGAWEVAARYNNVNLNNKDLKGGKMHNYTLGLNWYLNNNVKLMADYTWSKVSTGTGMLTGTTTTTAAGVITPGTKVGTTYSPRIAMLRAQVSF